MVVIICGGMQWTDNVQTYKKLPSIQHEEDGNTVGNVISPVIAAGSSQAKCFPLREVF